MGSRFAQDRLAGSRTPAVHAGSRTPARQVQLGAQTPARFARDQGRNDPIMHQTVTITRESAFELLIKLWLVCLALDFRVKLCYECRRVF